MDLVVKEDIKLEGKLHLSSEQFGFFYAEDNPKLDTVDQSFFLIKCVQE